MSGNVHAAESAAPAGGPTREEQAKELFAKLPDAKAREELVRLFHPLAGQLARRFAGRGESIDDLTQVASLGLIKAIDRFEVERGVRFDTYAIPTIVGELKRHFRDTSWAMRVPRGLQDRTLALRSFIEELDQELGRAPRVAEIAARVGMTDDEVIETLDAARALSVESLDALPANGVGIAETIGSEDVDMHLMELWADIGPLLRSLPERERLLLYYRFVADLPQSKIAEKLGISQMHVSRLLSRTCARLREGAARAGGRPDAGAGRGRLPPA